MSQFSPVNSPVKMEPTDEAPRKVEGMDEAEAPIRKEEPVKENGVNDEANGEEAASKAPATPRKRGRKDATNDTGCGGEVAGKDESPTKRKRASPKKPIAKVTQRPLPTSYENASPEDKMLLRMKDEENKSWADIRKAWEDLTGDKVGNSTLSGRYARIKANFVTFHDEDEERLLQFLKDIENKFESEKWHRVADAIAKAGGAKYPPTALQKKHKELIKKMGNVSLGEDTE